MRRRFVVGVTVALLRERRVDAAEIAAPVATFRLFRVGGHLVFARGDNFAPSSRTTMPTRQALNLEAGGVITHACAADVNLDQ